MQQVERIEIRADRLGALHVHHRRDPPRREAGADFRCRAAEPECVP
jgi:hypothetical protein